MITIGIDPGLDGGIAILEDGVIKELHIMPTLRVPKGKNKITRLIDTKGLVDTFSKYPGAIYYVEKVSSFFGISAHNNFRLGYGIGALHGCLMGLGYGFNLVTPKDWQKIIWQDADKVIKEKSDTDKKLKRSTTDTKATSHNAAMRIFKDQSFLKSSRSKKPHDGLIDAALIAYFGHIHGRT